MKSSHPRCTAYRGVCSGGGPSFDETGSAPTGCVICGSGVQARLLAEES